jgi:hypothetical protein
MADQSTPAIIDNPTFRTFVSIALTALLTLVAARYGITPAPLPALPQPVEQHFYGVAPGPVGDAK